MKRVVLFSGTGDGRMLSQKLRERGAVLTVCVASDYGAEAQGEAEGIQVLVGPRTAQEKQELLRNADFCVDATHPYATHITESVRASSAACGVPYLRLLRGISNAEDAVSFRNLSEAAAFCAGREGNILLTTGAKELCAFRAVARERLFPRILPSHEALSACEAEKIPHRNIIAMQGPFTKELNEALLRQYRIRLLVTKDGGDTGGFREKAEAARACGVELIVLRRPEETGFSAEEILNIIFEGET